MKSTRPFLISLEAKRLQERRSPTIAINPSHSSYRSTLPKLRLTQEVPSPRHRLTDRGWIERPSRPNRDYSRLIYARPLYLTTSVVRRATVVVIIGFPYIRERLSLCNDDNSHVLRMCIAYCSASQTVVCGGSLRGRAMP
jgi:hypothetical protein